MDIAVAGALERALVHLRTGADALRRIELPTLFGGVVDRSGAYAQVQRTLSHAESAVTVLQRAGIDGAPLESARTAVRMLDHAPLDEVALRSFGHVLSDHVERIRTDSRVMEGVARSFIDSPWTSLDAAQLRTLADVVDQGAPSMTDLPRALTDLPDAAVVLRAAAAGDPSAASGLAAYQDAWMVARLDGAERVAQLDDLLARETPLGATDSLRLASLADHPELAPTMPDAPQLARVGRSVASDATSQAATTLDRLRLDALVARSSDEAAGALLDSLMARSGSQLAPREWQRLHQLLGNERIRSLRAVPSDEPGLKPLLQIADAFANERYAWDSRVQRYFERYQVARLDDDAFAAQLDSLLLDRSGSTLTTDEWSRLSVLLEDTRGAGTGTSSMPGIKDLRTVARDYAQAKYPWDDRVAAHLEAHAMSKLDDDAAIARYRELVGSDLDVLSSEDWARLAGQASDPRIAPLVPRRISDLPDFPTAAMQQAKANAPGGGDARIYLERAAIANMSDTELLASFDQLIARGAAELEPGQWARLSTLIGDPRLADRIQSTLPGIKDFDRITRDMANAAYAYDGRIQAYFDSARLLAMDVDAVSAEFGELMARSGSELTPQDWARVFAITADPRMADQVPAAMPGMKSLQQVASDFAREAYDWDPRVQGYFERHAIARMDTDTVRAQFEALMAREGSTLSNEDWARIGALLGDTRIKEVAPPQLTGLKPFDHIAADFANGAYGWENRVQGYFERYKVSRLDEAVVRDELTGLFERPAADLTTADWNRLGALLDDTRVSELVPADVAGLKSLKQIAADMAGQRYDYDVRIQRYFDRFALAKLDDDALRSAVVELMDRPGRSLSTQDWARLGELLATRRAATVTRWPSDIPGLKSLQQIADDMAASRYAYDARIDQYFSTWAMRNDPTYIARFEAAIDALATGTATSEQRAMATAHPQELDQLLAGRPDAERLAIATAMLDNDGVASSRTVKDTLVAIRESLDARDGATGTTAQLVADTRELVERNLARLDGQTPKDAVRGYSNHPDYAEIGRLRANLQLIERLEAGGSTGAGASHEVAPAVRSGVDVGSGGDEQLAW